MSLNVLVVDDSSVMRSMVIRSLRLCGLPLSEIYEAGNGKEGLGVLEREWVDLALVDINMPVLNGEEMIKRVRENPETEALAVIVVSTESSETRIDSLRQYGAGFVHKPFSPEKLRDIILEITGVGDAGNDRFCALPGSGPDF